MGQVLVLEKKKNVDQGLVAMLEEMLASARRGEARGSWAAFDMADGTQRIISRGTFSQDEERAMRIVQGAIDLYCQEAGIAHPKVAAYCALPRGLATSGR